MHKIRLSLDGEKGELTSLLNELQMWNLSLKHCFERVEIPPMESIHDRAVTAMHDLFTPAKCDKAIEDAQILHEALTGSWSCTCAVPHHGSLRLNWHMMKAFAPARFEMAVSSEEAAGGASRVAWKTIKMTVDSTKDQDSIVHPPRQHSPPTSVQKPTKQTKPAKRVRIQEFLSFRTSKSTVPPTKQVVGKCSVL